MNVHANNNFRDLAAADFDTTTLLAHAAEQAIERRYEDFFIVDVDWHHYETEAFNGDRWNTSRIRCCATRPSIQGMARGGIASETAPTRRSPAASPAIRAARSRRCRRRRTATSR